MKFCPKCGSLLMPRKDAKGPVLACTSCKYTEKSKEPIATKISESRPKAADIPIVTSDSEDSTLPTTEAKCEKCGNNDAYYWLIQTRAGDEPETKFLKCTACKHVWRDYD
jgi:transcription factor S